MANTQKTVIVTGGSQGIGAGVVTAFLDRGYNVVANSRSITKSGAFEASDKLALVDGSIAEAATATKIAEVAKSEFGSIDALVKQRRHIFLEALHGLHRRRSAVSRLRQYRRFSFH
jgi:NAD(P)-dependent dehydrogenase (short-subunit alcohol dehydrogenase family)